MVTALVKESTGDGFPGVGEAARTIVRFEAEMLWAMVDLETQAGTGPFPLDRRGADALIAPADPTPAEFPSRPVRTGWARVGTFPAGVEAAVTAAAAGTLEAAGAFDGQPDVGYVFQKRGDLAPRVFRASDQTLDLLALCDGSRTVPALCEEVAARYGVAPATVREALSGLVSAGSSLSARDRRPSPPPACGELLPITQRGDGHGTGAGPGASRHRSPSTMPR